MLLVPSAEEERVYHKGFRDGWDAAINHAENIASDRGFVMGTVAEYDPPKKSPKPKRKASAYSKRYGAAFRKVAGRFKKKNGSWKNNGYKNAVKAAHKLAKR